MLAPAMLEAVDVYRYYGARCAVSGLSFRVHEGECVGLLGLNGAGKSTALRMLAGLCAPTRGLVRIRGEVLSPEAHDVRGRIGFLPDRPPLYDAMTVRAYLRFAARLRGVAPSRVECRVADVCDACDLVTVMARPIAGLSQGFRQRVGIAQALVHEPSLVVLDEPSQGLDPAQRLTMRALIRKLKERHTVVLSTHLLGEARECCDRVLLLHEGRLHADGTEAELVRRLSRTAGQVVEVVVAGPRAALEDALADLQGVLRSDVRQQGNELHVALECDRDLRGALSRALIAQGLELLALGQRADGLEGVFSSLTRRDAETVA